MSLHNRMVDLVNANPSLNEEELTDLLIGGLQQDELEELLVEEFGRILRALARKQERLVQMDEILSSTREAVKRHVAPRLPADLQALINTNYTVVHGRTRRLGEMTIADHEARIVMLESQKAGLQNSIDFHRNLIAMLRAADAECLDELAEEVAA